MKHDRTALALAALLAAACASTPKRNPVPLDLVERAAVPGLPGVRAFGDAEPDAELSRERTLALVEEIRAAHPEGTPTLHWLAMSGGAADGAFGAGLLNGWSESGARPEFQLVTGVSTGALTAPFVFLGPEYDPDLERFYTEIRAEEIVRQRGLFSIIGSSSFAVSTPLQDLLREMITPELLADVAREHGRRRRLIVATSNLDADRPVLWDLGRLAGFGTPESAQLFRDVLLASASVPGVFPPVLFDVEVDGETYDELHVDGGIHNQVTLLSPGFEVRDALRDAGFDPRIDLWVVRNRPVTAEYAATEAELFAILSRSMTVTTRSQGVGDVYRLYLTALRDGMQFHLAAIPEDFREPREEEFDPVYMRKLFERGRELGRSGAAWAEAPPGFEPGQVVAGPPEE